MLDKCGYNCTFCSVSLQEDSPRYHCVVRNAGGFFFSSNLEKCLTVVVKLIYPSHSAYFVRYLIDRYGYSVAVDVAQTYLFLPCGTTTFFKLIFVHVIFCGIELQCIYIITCSDCLSVVHCRVSPSCLSAAIGRR